MSIIDDYNTIQTNNLIARIFVPVFMFLILPAAALNYAWTSLFGHGENFEPGRYEVSSIPGAQVATSLPWTLFWTHKGYITVRLPKGSEIDPYLVPVAMTLHCRVEGMDGSVLYNKDLIWTQSAETILEDEFIYRREVKFDIPDMERFVDRVTQLNECNLTELVYSDFRNYLGRRGDVAIEKSGQVYIVTNNSSAPVSGRWVGDSFMVSHSFLTTGRSENKSGLFVNGDNYVYELRDAHLTSRHGPTKKDDPHNGFIIKPGERARMDSRFNGVLF